MNKFKQKAALLLFYTSAKLQAESYRHFAGYLWWLVDPLLNLGIYYFLFKVILNRGEDSYIAFLLVGLTVWKWIGDSIAKSSNSILNNLEILKKIKLDASIFPIIDILICSWKFLIIFLLMILVLGIALGFSLNHLFLIPLLLSGFTFLIGIGLFFSSMIPFMPDFGFVVTYSLRLIFYASCVIFSERKIPPEYRFLFDFNPVAVNIKGFRLVLIDLAQASTWSYIYPFCLGLIFGIIGRKIISWKNQEYPKLH